MAGDDVTITIRADSGDAIRAFRDVNGHLRDMRGRFVSDSSIMTRSMSQLGKSVGNIKGYLIPLATAGVPVIASLGAASLKTAGSVGGATVAVAAFGAAVAGQVSHLSEASDAQKKYEDAVVKSGRGSKEAAEAQRTLSSTLAGMPNSTARAAVALGTLKDTFQEFSDSTADFTMTPVEKSFTLLGQIIPKLTPMAKDASTQLDRLVSVAGGAMATPGFDELSDKLATFANDSLKSAVDGIIHFSRALSEGEVSGPVKAFMDYAAANGPAVQEALSSIGGAVTTLVEAAAVAGPGMLTLVSAAAELVAALPPELVATVMQLAVGLKLVTLAGAGAAAISGGVAALGAKIAALQAASVAAGGGMAGLAAAFGTLGKAAKASIIVAGIAALVVAVEQLSSIGDKAPPSVDRLTTSLGNLGRTGKATGYVADQFGKDFSKLKDQIDKVTSPSVTESINNWGADITGGLLSAGDATEEFTKSMDSIDDALAGMVKGGNAELAKAALASMTEGMSPEQAKKFREGLDGFDQAMADVALEAKLTADSMGIFGQAAQDTSAKLSAQKQSADGLRASILALNDVNRDAHDAQTQFGAALDDLTASFKENGATLSRDTEEGRKNRDMMSAAAAAHDEMIASGLAAGDSMKSMQKDSAGLRAEMMELAEKAFKGNTEKATEYVNTLLGVPSEIKTIIKAEKEQAIAGLEEVRSAIQATPDAKEVKVDTLNAAAIAALEAVGLKTKQLPDGKTAVYTANGQALGSIGSVSTALNNLNGKTARTFTTHTIRTINEIITKSKTYRSVHDIVGSANGNIFNSVRAYANGGEDHTAQISGPTMRVWAEPETGGEAYIPLATGKRPRSLEILAEVADRFGFGLEQYARGGTTKAQKKAKERAEAERDARKDARGDLTISYFGKKAGFKNTEFANALGSPGSLGDLSSALNKWRSIIKKATHGGVENSLLKRLNSAGSALMKYEKQHDKISKTLEKAKALRDDVSSGLKSEAGIVKSANAEDSKVTINTILSEMTGSAANTKEFSGMLEQLRKKGLSGDLIKQIAEAGIGGGGMETAAAILGGGKGEIKKLNDLQKQIGKSAKAAGNAAADAMYGAGMKAGEGLIAGLEKQQKAIEKQMMKIAKAMEKSIKKALGIKSPSRVMEEVGDYTAEGFAVGMRKNRSVMPAWASMLNQPRTTMPASTGRAGAGGAPGWGDRPVAITLQIGTGQLGEIIIDPVRKAITTRGGLKATFPQDFR